MNAMERLNQKIQETNCRIVAGLDPTIQMVPNCLQFSLNNPENQGRSEMRYSEVISLERFCKGYISAIAGIVPAVKMNSAFFEAEHLQLIYRQVAGYAKRMGLFVIGDLKRSDIGSTSKAYAEAWLGADSPFDAITINPYFGTDGVMPFIEMAAQNGKGVFVLVKTSNKSSAELQDKVIAETQKPLYQEVALLVKQWGEKVADEYHYNPVGAVVGATHPKEAEVLRELMPNTMFLVPGYGAQGATAKDVAVNFDKNGLGAIVNSSRGIMCAYQKEKYADLVKENGEGWKDAVKKACMDAKADINAGLNL